MNSEREPSPEVVREFFEGLMKAGWDTSVTEVESQEELKIIKFSNDSIMVEGRSGLKTIPFDSVTEFKSKNPNPKS